MSDQRISLTRVLAFNWYGFRQVLDLTNHTLIAGAFGTGKTALLDLMQYVLLGEHWRPNRAAAGSARSRSLASYCLCDTNTLRDGEPHYTRSSGVTLIGLEFTWPEEKGQARARRETWGVRLEYTGPTAEPKRTYFLIPERLEWGDIAPDGKLLDEETFRTRVRREYEIGSGRKCLFSRQVDYLAEMATPRHLYFDLEAFQKTLAKAIAFEPEASVEEFIRRFILEESPLDVRDVKVAQDAYRETEARLAKQEDEAAFLRRIDREHAGYEAARRRQAVLIHVRNALSHAQAEERLAGHRAVLERLQAEFADDQRNLDSASAELEQVAKVINEARLEASRDPDQVKLDDLTRRSDELKRRIDDLSEAARSVHDRLTERHDRLTQWLGHGEAIRLEGLTEVLAADDTLLEALHSGPDETRLAALPQLARWFNEVFQAVDKLIAPIRQELEGAERRLRQVVSDLQALDQSRMPGAFPFFEEARSRLGDRVEQLGRLVEVRPEEERWWPALELALGGNRWAVVVAREDYAAALDILRRTPPGRELERLINPAEVHSPRRRRDRAANSLAAKVEATNPTARAFVDHLLGDVVCVADAEELERCEAERAITRDGMLKRVPVRRRLRPAGEVPLTLGRRGIERMRTAREREQIETRAQRDALKQRLDDVNTWIDGGKQGGLGDATLPDRSAELPLLPRWRKEFEAVRETIQLLITPEREARLRKLADHERRKSELDGRIAVLAERRRSFSLRAKPHEEGVATAEEDLVGVRITMAESRARLGPGLLDPELDAESARFVGGFPTWEKRLLAAQTEADEAERKAIEARNARNRERLALTTARNDQGHMRHPEYQADFPADDESNEAWSARLRLLETVELARSRDLAAERRKDWERRLQEGVLDRINEKIQDAERTIRQLRQYLDRRIGHHIYRISQRREPAFAALWHLLDTGLAPTDPLVQGIKSDEIERAMEELMAAVEAADKADDRARRLLDYRYYHRYDLEMLVADRPDAPPISLGRSGRSLSGGENQAPFFISMLAAFRRVYDLGSPGRSRHIGLVVMDEAFSKLSGDGVEDCLQLAKNFQLQLVMAFPIDRLGVMAPYADTVVVCRKEEQRDEAGYVTRVDNIPILLPPDEVREALE